LLFCTSTCTSGRVRSSRIGSWGISAPQNLPASFELATLAEMQVVQQNKGQQTSWVSSTSATDATGFRWCRYARSNTPVWKLEAALYCEPAARAGTTAAGSARISSG
jgi:hypothetical protein